MTIDPLSQLPLFATDQQLAVAIVGKDRASMWVKAVIPQLEKRGSRESIRCMTVGQCRSCANSMKGISA